MLAHLKIFPHNPTCLTVSIFSDFRLFAASCVPAPSKKKKKKGHLKLAQNVISVPENPSHGKVLTHVVKIWAIPQSHRISLVSNECEDDSSYQILTHPFKLQMFFFIKMVKPIEKKQIHYVSRPDPGWQMLRERFLKGFRRALNESHPAFVELWTKVILLF